MSTRGPRPISEAEVYEALRQVEDPELGVDIVNLGLVYGVAIEDQRVTVEMTLTSLGCPAAELLEYSTREAVSTVPGVRSVRVQWTFDPPWTPDRITEEGRDLLIAQGYL